MTLFLEYLYRTYITAEPQSLYEPANYMLSLGGKRLRPLVCLAACELFGGKPEQALPAAAAVEWFHNFTLVHDDVMDKAETRRGKDTVHCRYGINTAILSGDMMLVKAYQLLQNYPPELLSCLLDVFSRTAIQVCEGQQYDMDFETTIQVSMPDYLKMIALKTAVLLAASLQMGAIIAQAPTHDAQHLYDFGWHIGVAFQLQDDILDTYGTEQQTGKRVGGDILNNKKTCLLITALEKADSPTKTELHTWLDNQSLDNAEQKIAAVTAIFTRTNALDAAQSLMNEHYQKALEHLHQIAVPDQNKQTLRQLAADLMYRKT